ncbi:uncharacterized protein LOC136090884 [Hydra vulgaris]|uniref:Uncharacterized protein LOC136090884 n=1 Tax=Hydra vulgaris TaxID=6087 RepID=A0ABM4DHH8_HYDVU
MTKATENLRIELYTKYDAIIRTLMDRLNIAEERITKLNLELHTLKTTPSPTATGNNTAWNVVVVKGLKTTSKDQEQINIINKIALELKQRENIAKVIIIHGGPKSSSTNPSTTKAQDSKNCSHLYDVEIIKNAVNKEKDIVNKENINKFYSFINSKSKRDHSVAPLARSDSSICLDDCKETRNLNDFFGSVFITDNGVNPSLGFPSHQNSLSKVLFPYDSVVSLLQKLPAKFSKSPDGYPPIFLKSIATTIAIPHSILFEISMTTSSIPKTWKSAITCPIFKKGYTSLPTNYRPIFMICIVFKVMESIIIKTIKNYLLEKNSLSQHRFGFINCRSTWSQMRATLNEWTTTVNNKKIVAIIYTDFKKAFDSVTHPKLMFKLQYYGIK